METYDPICGMLSCENDTGIYVKKTNYDSVRKELEDYKILLQEAKNKNILLENKISNLINNSGLNKLKESVQIVRDLEQEQRSELETSMEDISLRDYFAARAQNDDINQSGDGKWISREEAKYAYADRMISARSAIKQDPVKIENQF